jgi:Gpi18-like mannosyltransferase
MLYLMCSALPYAALCLAFHSRRLASTLLLFFAASQIAALLLLELRAGLAGQQLVPLGIQRGIVLLVLPVASALLLRRGTRKQDVS